MSLLGKEKKKSEHIYRAECLGKDTKYFFLSFFLSCCQLRKYICFLENWWWWQNFFRSHEIELIPMHIKRTVLIFASYLILSTTVSLQKIVKFYHCSLPNFLTLAVFDAIHEIVSVAWAFGTTDPPHLKQCNHSIRKGKSNPVTGLDTPWGFQEVEPPRFQDNCHMKVVTLSALRTDHLYPPGNIPGTHFC